MKFYISLFLLSLLPAFKEAKADINNSIRGHQHPEEKATNTTATDLVLPLLAPAIRGGSRRRDLLNPNNEGPTETTTARELTPSEAAPLCLGTYEASNVVASHTTTGSTFAESSEYCTYEECSYDDSYVKYDQPMTEFTFSGADTNLHKRIALSPTKIVGDKYRGSRLALLGLFPNGRVWAPGETVTSYDTDDEFKLQLDTANDIIKLYKNNADTGKTFPAQGLTSFYVSLWFYERDASVKTVCPPPPCGPDDPDDATCCVPGWPCHAGQGDCDNDDDCLGSLVCGRDNCGPGFPSTHDCCYNRITCNGYYCDKRLDDIFIVMTHNSLALPALPPLVQGVLSPNQNYGLNTQFNDGIRGFTLDLYSDGDNVKTKHGGNGYNPKTQVDELLQALRAKPSEFVLIQLEDYMSQQSRDTFLSWIGNSIITNFDISKPIGHYLDQGKQILLVTDKSGNVDAARGVHNTKAIVTENDYGWESCYFGSNLMGHRRGPQSGSSFKLMNHFCSLTGTGDMIASDSVNQKHRILYGARRFLEQAYSGGIINGILVDYYEEGDVFGAQREIRQGDFNDGCWGDGDMCGEGTTCWECCNESEFWWGATIPMTACGKEPCWSDGTECLDGTSCNQCCNGSEWWDSKFFTACGNEPCWSDGTECLAGTTCGNCCNGSEWWDSKFFTACGAEPCWSDGTICAAGTTCDNCCNDYEWWDSKFITACGDEPCWGRGTVCGAGTTCNSCCKGADCPWYQFGVCECK